MKITMQKLNKHLSPLLVALVLIVGMCCPITASADKWYDPIDYRELDYKVTMYGAEYNEVSVPLPEHHFAIDIWNKNEPNSSAVVVNGKGSATFDLIKGQNYVVDVYPTGQYGLALDGLPSGTELHFDLLLTVHAEKEVVITLPDVYVRSHFRTSDGFKNVTGRIIAEDYPWGTPIAMNYTVGEFPENATSYVPYGRCQFLSGYDWAQLTVVMSNVRLEMDISRDYWEQWQVEQNGKKLDNIVDALGDVEDAIDDSGRVVAGAVGDAANAIIGGTPDMDDMANESNKEMSAAAGKLDNLGDQLNSVEKPNINTFKIGIGDMIGDTTSIPMLTAPIREIWESPVALGIMTIVITLVLVSWVFFGKKK